MSDADIATRRSQDVKEMFNKGEQILKDRYEQKKENDKTIRQRLYDQFVNKNGAVIRAVRDSGLKINPDDNPVNFLDELNYISGIQQNYLEDIESSRKKLRKLGISDEQVGEYIFYKNITEGKVLQIDEEGKLFPVTKYIARPLGHTPQTAQRQLEYMKNTLGENYKVLEEETEKFYDENQKIMESLIDVGIFTPEQVKVIRTNKYYATTRVLDYMKEYVSPGFIKQIGTLKESSNPYTATIQKMLSAITLREKQKTRVALYKFLRQTEDVPIPADSKWTGLGREFVDKEGYGMLMFRREGKLVGYYIDPYIAETVTNRPVQETNAIMKGLRVFNSGYLRPIYTTWNVGFQVFNVQRDFWSAVKANPHKSLLLSMLDTTVNYIRAFPHAVKEVVGVRDNLIREMKDNKILGMTYADLAQGSSRDDITELEYLQHKYGLRSELGRMSLSKLISLPLRAYIRFTEMLGNVIERTPKIAGYLTLKNHGIPIKQMGHEIRNYYGSPDFRIFGTSGHEMNNIQLFSNAIIRGNVSNIEMGFKNPRTRTGYWWKTFQVNILPKILMALATIGIFGEYLKKAYKKATEYDKTNYTIVPLWIDDRGKVVYLRLPQDETGRIIGAMIWKIINPNKTGNILQTSGDILSYSAGQLPGLNPAIELSIAGMMYVSGKNPYDFYRGRGILNYKNEDILKVKGWTAKEPLLEFIKYTGDKLGLPFIGYQTSRINDKVQSEFEKFARLPIISRFLRVTDYGGTETKKYKEAQKRVNRR